MPLAAAIVHQSNVAAGRSVALERPTLIATHVPTISIDATHVAQLLITATREAITSIIGRILAPQVTATHAPTISIVGRHDMAKRTNVELFQGEDKTLEFTVKNAAESAVVDVTGWTTTFTARQRSGDTTSVLSKAGSIVAGPSGRIDITLTDDDTNKLAPGDYVYDLKRLDAGNESVLAYGRFRVLTPVTA